MNNKCNCGGRVNSFATPTNQEKIYKDLLCCIDCDRRYQLVNNELHYITRSKFREIVIDRLNNYK